MTPERPEQEGGPLYTVIAIAIVVGLVIWLASCLADVQAGIDYGFCKQTEQLMDEGCS